jgi:SpoVK/Ycf46/Vps4 family AAA+-type ATPase
MHKPQSERLAALARRIEPKAGWSDIVLPDSTLEQLRELQDRIAHVGAWFAKRSLHPGTRALFVGARGTGKTMAAAMIAKRLDRELYEIDLASVVSKYIGEAENGLDAVFAAAADANAVLFFGEADALLGKRTEVKDAHDRYANLEIGYLLQRMEGFEGVAILATNSLQNIDPAFLRRFAMTIHFPPREPELVP